jgi:hypothetical protein
MATEEDMTIEAIIARYDARMKSLHTKARTHYAYFVRAQILVDVLASEWLGIA